MKICPACHRETFDGRSTCHRCGSDVSGRPALELPTSDPALLLTLLPWYSKGGTLHLDIDGLRFSNEADEELIHVPARHIRDVEPRGVAELWVHHEDEPGRDARIRLRVRWAPRAERYRPSRRPDYSTVMMHTWRPIVPLFGFGGDARRRNVRDREVGRDRWLWSLKALLGIDRYVSGPRPSVTS